MPSRSLPFSLRRIILSAVVAVLGLALLQVVAPPSATTSAAASSQKEEYNWPIEDVYKENCRRTPGSGLIATRTS